MFFFFNPMAQRKNEQLYFKLKSAYRLSTGLASNFIATYLVATQQSQLSNCVHRPDGPAVVYVIVKPPPRHIYRNTQDSSV